MPKWNEREFKRIVKKQTLRDRVRTVYLESFLQVNHYE